MHLRPIVLIALFVAFALSFTPGPYAMGKLVMTSWVGQGMQGSTIPVTVPSPAAAWNVSPTRMMVLDVGPAGSADSVYARAPFVLRDSDGVYRMWYSGYDGYRNRLLYATSQDGMHWTKQGVVFDVGSAPYYWDSVGGESVLQIGSTYHMWFSAGYWSGGAFGYWAQIYHATSTDAVHWNITGVALPPGTGWDAGMVNSPRVIRDARGIFWLFFFGWDGTTNRIGVATSTNGTSFVPYADNPVVNLGPSGSWDSNIVQDSAVALDGSSWTMWYDAWNGTAWQIGLAYSNTGFNWTKDSLNPVLRPESSVAWDSTGVAYPDFFAAASRLYFGGSDGQRVRIGLVNLSVPGTGNHGAGPSDTVLGLSLPFLAVLIGFFAVAVALFVWIGLVLSADRRRGPK